MKSHLKGDLTHLLYPLVSDLLFSCKHMRLVVGLHTESGHVLFRTAFGEGGKDADALRQADDLFV